MCLKDIHVVINATSVVLFQELINHLRHSSVGISTSPGLTPACCQQVISSMKIISGEDGTDLGMFLKSSIRENVQPICSVYMLAIGAKRIAALRDNSNFFRQKLIDMGAHVLGDWDSPVVPLMLCNPAKIPAFSHECLKRNVRCVYPFDAAYCMTIYANIFAARGCRGRVSSYTASAFEGPVLHICSSYSCRLGRCCTKD